MYTQEKKDRAVYLYHNTDMSMSAIASREGISATTMSNWINIAHKAKSKTMKLKIKKKVLKKILNTGEGEHWIKCWINDSQGRPRPRTVTSIYGGFSWITYQRKNGSPWFTILE
jgi:predicted DNA-binding protein YlxM (UPF0122 family)